MHLNLAITLFPGVMPSDFIGPNDVLHSLSPGNLPSNSSYSITITTLASTLEPIELSNGIKVVANKTFAEALKDQRRRKWDAVLIPGGRGARPWEEGNKECREFLKVIVPDCKYVLTVCTGSWLLSSTGLLRGQSATTNKAAFKAVLENTKADGVTWIPKARWVVSEKFWTSSGVTAGVDMASAFLKYFVGLHEDTDKVDAIADKLLGILEVRRGVVEGDDEWAEYYGLT